MGKSDTCVCGTRWCPQCTVSKQLLTSRFYHSHYAAFIQRCNQQKCKNASCNSRNQKWNYIDEDPGRSDSHNILQQDKQPGRQEFLCRVPLQDKSGLACGKWSIQVRSKVLQPYFREKPSCCQDQADFVTGWHKMQFLHCTRALT